MFVSANIFEIAIVNIAMLLRFVFGFCYVWGWIPFIADYVRTIRI